MGKRLSFLFVEQFKLYKQLSNYLMNEIPLQEVEEWKRILNSQEYIWPIGKDQGELSNRIYQFTGKLKCFPLHICTTNFISA